jgi:hypothetical protein
LLVGLRQAVDALPNTELPGLLAGVEGARAAAWVRLMAQPQLVSTEATRPAAPTDHLLTPQEALAVVGGSPPRSLKWLYRHTRGLRFRRDISRKVVRFEEQGLRRWLASRAMRQP